MGKHYQPAADNASAIACTLEFHGVLRFEFASARFADANLRERVHGFVIERAERLCAEPQRHWRRTQFNKKSPGPAGALFDMPEKLATGGRRHSAAITGIVGLDGDIGECCTGIASPELFGRDAVGHSGVVTVGSRGRLRCCCNK
jgi:hypothetical protein